jgi:hypothetical protein
MPNKTNSKNHTIIPNGMSETVDASESEDEINKIQEILKNQLLMNDTSSSSDAEEKYQQNTSKSKSKKKKEYIGIRNLLCLQHQHLLEVYHHLQAILNLNQLIISTRCLVKNHLIF